MADYAVTQVDEIVRFPPVLLEQRLAQAEGATRTALPVDAMSPARHWTPAGLLATRLFWRDLRD